MANGQRPTANGERRTANLRPIVELQLLLLLCEDGLVLIHRWTLDHSYQRRAALSRMGHKHYEQHNQACGAGLGRGLDPSRERELLGRRVSPPLPQVGVDFMS